VFVGLALVIRMVVVVGTMSGGMLMIMLIRVPEMGVIVGMFV
jgi:hypothetical protein